MLSEPRPEPARPLQIRSAEAGVRPPGTWDELRSLWDARSLLGTFILKDLQTRYVGSTIGFFWTVVNPLLELLTYTFVFHVLIGVRFHPSGTTGHYVLFLFCGMVAWSAFVDGVTRATTSITAHAHLMRKLNFPAAILPAHLILSCTLNQVFRLGILFLAVLLVGDGLSWHALLAFPFMLVQAAFTMGLGFFFATMHVYFRDTAHWINAALMLGMFMTPVFYPAAAYPRQFVLLLYPNPMAQLIGVYQSLILNHQLPAPNQMLFATVVAALTLIAGASVFANNRRRFADLV